MPLIITLHGSYQHTQPGNNMTKVFVRFLFPESSRKN